jgi:aspartate/methionine/tyrosine aminotransferase
MITQVIVDEAARPAPLALMPNPFYQVYLGGALMAGAEPVLVDAPASTGFLPDYAALPPEVLDRAAVVTLCSPANPQGAVASLEMWKTLITLARRHDFVVLADECYSEIYADTPPPGALEACAALGGSVDNVLVFNSLSKRSSVPGLRSGFVAGDPALIDRFRRLRAYAAAGMPFPLQAVSAALWSDEAHAAENRRLYQDKVADAARILGINAPPGGFFLWLPVPDGEAFTRRLWAEDGIKVLPGAYLARPTFPNGAPDGTNVGAGYARIALVHDRDTTARALERIAACRHREGI